MVQNEICSKADWDDFRKRAGKARCFVRMTDSFMSGWGHAEGMQNVLYVAVMDSEDAYKLISWIHWERKEMKYVNWGYLRDKPPACIYDSNKLVQGCIYENWLKEARCKPIEA